jgi:hypothetical protein
VRRGAGDPAAVELDVLRDLVLAVLWRQLVEAEAPLGSRLAELTVEHFGGSRANAFVGRASKKHSHELQEPIHEVRT